MVDKAGNVDQVSTFADALFITKYEVQLAFQQRLIKKGFLDVQIPARHQSFGV